jgi:hypothetical protein
MLLCSRGVSIEAAGFVDRLNQGYDGARQPVTFLKKNFDFA